MKKDKAGALKSLLASTLKIGFIGFGGGSALIPVIQKTVVEEKKLVDQTEYEEDVVVASVTPGALPVEISGSIGKRIAGWKGMLVGSIGMAFPGVFLTLALLSVISYVDENVLRQIQFLAVGITAFITCLLSDYVAGTVKKEKAKASKWQNVIIIAVVFLLTCGKNIYRILGLEGSPRFALSNIQIFGMAFLVIFLMQVFRWIKKRFAGRNEKTCGIKNGTGISGYYIKQMFSELAALLLFVLLTGVVAYLMTGKTLPYLLNGLLSSVMSFGGGDAYLTVAEGLFVETSLISEDSYYGSLVPLVNVLPGSILCKTLSGIGFYIGLNETGSVLAAYSVALAGFAISIFGSCGVVSIVGCFYNAFHNMEVFIAIRRWIRPIVAGLMLNVILALVYQNCKLGNCEALGLAPVLVMFGIYLLDMYLYHVKKIGSGKIVLVSIGLSVIACNMCSMFF
ncbi:MAG: chromate transporter [Lachnospiraceae bacterium]|nr:chromate transporter [Lachnospiraceae bacterium]